MRGNQYKLVLFQLHRALYKEMKARAAKKGFSMRRWLTRAVVAYMQEEDKYKLNQHPPK